MWNEQKCDRCGDCLVKCQYVDYPREKAISQIEKLIFGENAEILSECITCCACNEYCPQGADPFELINELQEKYGVLPVPEKTARWMAAGAMVPSEKLEGGDEKPALSLCVMEPMVPSQALDGDLFANMTVLKGGDYFCFLGNIHIGKASPVKENAQRFIGNLAATGAKRIVLFHDDCYAMIKKMPELDIEVPFEAVHLVEYLREYLKSNRDKIKPLDRKIAYQRPCASRFSPELDPVLDDVFELMGVERTDRAYDRDTALCCGTIFSKIYPEKIQSVQQKNMDDMVNAGSEAMVFLCPVCMAGLASLVKQRDRSPIFITELVRMAVGELPFPDPA
ncbi:MAG: (Fe-S)-binding protein [Desulfobacterales bacterium]|nr:(Fe-S)-binding protein [Desulfobacterales bacterium]